MSLLCPLGGMVASFLVSHAVGWGDVWFTTNPAAVPRVFMLWLFFTGPAIGTIYLIALAFRRKDPTENEWNAGTDIIGFPIVTRRQVLQTVMLVITGAVVAMIWAAMTTQALFALLGYHYLSIGIAMMLIWTGLFGNNTVSDAGIALRPLPGIIVPIQASEHILSTTTKPNGDVRVTVETDLQKRVATFELGSEDAEEVLAAWDRHKRLIHASAGESPHA